MLKEILRCLVDSLQHNTAEARTRQQSPVTPFTMSPASITSVNDPQNLSRWQKAGGMKWRVEHTYNPEPWQYVAIKKVLIRRKLDETSGRLEKSHELRRPKLLMV